MKWIKSKWIKFNLLWNSEKKEKGQVEIIMKWIKFKWIQSNFLLNSEKKEQKAEFR